MSDKRQFQRIHLNVPGTLSHEHNHIRVQVLDLSLQGFKMQAHDNDLDTLPFDSHDPYTLTFRVNPDSPPITAQLEQLYRQPVRQKPEMLLGCKVCHIELDSLAALRRLIELNSRSEALAEQDLDALVALIYDKASNASLS